MAAPLTTGQSTDLQQYRDLMLYLVGILDNEASIDVANRQLTPTNITKINDNIAKVLDNMSAILLDAL